MTTALDDVLALAERLPFMRLVALLEQLLGCQVGSALADERLLLAHDPALAFHAQDVTAAVRIDEGDGAPPRVRVVSAFAGLTGAVSPLSTALLDAHARDEDLLPFVRLLLDVFHHRLLGLFYRGLYARAAPAHDPGGPAHTFILALAGLIGSTATRTTGLPEARLLALSPLVIAHPPNTARLVVGVLRVLDDLRDGARVRVHEQRGARVSIAASARAALGRNLRLGRTSTLGHKARCRSAAIELEIAGLSPEDCAELAPGGRRWPALRATVRLLTPDDLDVVLVLQPSPAPRPHLDQTLRLGRTWLCGGSHPSAARFRLDAPGPRDRAVASAEDAG